MKYYITAMMFIVFDIEIVFLYPWAVYFDSMKFFGLVEMVLFIADRVRGLRVRVAPRRTGVGLMGTGGTWVSRRSCPAASC